MTSRNTGAGEKRGALRREESSRAAVTALVIAGVLWGTAFLMGKLALRELTVSQLVLFRFAIASLALLPISVKRRAWPTWKDAPRFLLTGFLAVPVTFLLQYNGLARTTVSRASLIIGAIPPLLALAGAAFLRERPGARGWVAVVASMLGVALIAGWPDGGSRLGDGLVFLSTIVTVAWVLLNKRLSERYTALIATTHILLFGTLTLAPISLLWDGPPRWALSGAVWASVLALGLLCTALAFVLWNWGLERVPVSRAGVYLNLEPLVGTLLGVTLLHDSLGPGVIFGGLLVLGAAWAASRPEGGGYGRRAPGWPGGARRSPAASWSPASRKSRRREELPGGVV